MTYSLLNTYFSNITNQFKSACLLLNDGTILHASSEQPEDNYSLAMTFQTAKKFLPIQSGDVVLINDPYSGGTHLQKYTFITRLHSASPLIPEVYLCVRKNFQEDAQLNLYTDSIENEGVRIPPTPIYQGFKANNAIIEAISAHPKSPQNLQNWLIEFSEKILSLSQKNLPLPLKDFFHIQNIKKYLSFSKEKVLQVLSESSHGDSQCEISLHTGELIKLRLSVESDKIIFDFSGTSSGVKTFLTEPMTLGVCWFATLEKYNLLHLFNSGTLELIQVIKPLQSFLNAKYPNPTLVGAIEGIPAVKTISEWGFLKISTKQIYAPENKNPLFCQLKFQNNKVLTFSLLNGTSGNESHAGECSISNYTSLENISVQKIESEFPVRFLQISERPSQVKKTKTSGGSGLQIKFKLLEPAEMSWTNGLIKNQLKIKNKIYIPNAEPEVHLQSEDKKEILPFSGKRQIELGATISLLSGFGVNYN